MKAGNYWLALRGALVGWLAAFCGVAVLLLFIMHRQSAAEVALAKVKQHLQQAQQQVMHEASYQSDIDFYLARHAKWQTLGFMQLPDLDHWEAAWATMQQQSRLPHLSYQIQPSVSCSGASCRQHWPTSQPPALNFTVTPIHLSWSVNHEVAMLDWLQQFYREYTGMLLVRHCRWQATEQVDEIAAQCDLEMFNFPDVLPDTLAGHT